MFVLVKGIFMSLNYKKGRICFEKEKNSGRSIFINSI